MCYSPAMDFISIIAFIVLFFWIWRLSGEVKQLRSRPAPAPSPALKPTVIATATPGTIPHSAPAGPSLTMNQVPVAPRQDKLMDFIEWLKEDWLLKLGAVLLLIAFGWFVSYAFINNWIGPMGRIALGLLAGTLLLVGGWWRMNKFANQGGSIMVVGSTVILLTTFAAREIYGYFTPTTALLIMFATTALVALASVRFNTKSLALASLILAGSAPLLTSAPANEYVSWFIYLLVVVAGAIWIITLKNWRDLTAVALLIVTLYSAPHWAGLLTPDLNILLALSFAFAALFFLTNTIGIVNMKSPREKELVPDLITAAGNGLFLLAWILTAGPEEWQSLLIAGWMIIFALGAYLVYRVSDRHEPFYVYAAVSIAMLAAATAVELDGPMLTLAYIVESALIPIVAYLVLWDLRVAQRLLFLLVGPMILSVTSITSRAWRTQVIHDDFFVLLLLTAVLIGHGLFFWWREQEEHPTEEAKAGPILLVIGSIYAYMLWWLVTHAAFLNDDMAVLASLVVYTVIGIASYVYGGVNNSRVLRIYGGILLGFVVGRLLLIDVWRLELTWRIIVFAVIGVLLMSTAFMARAQRQETKLMPPA